MPVDHTTPLQNYVYRHTPTGDLIEYLTRTESEYKLRVNRDRTLDLRTEDWPEYRQHLTVARKR